MRAFILPMLWREARASSRRLLLLVLCIAAGVGGLVSVKSFSLNLQSAIHSEARTLMAADLVVRDRRAPGEAEQAALEDLRAQGAHVVNSIQFVSMARSPQARRVELASVRAVGADYPFYGEVVTQSGEPLRALLTDDTVLVHNTLLLKMGLSVGDTLQIGKRAFRIADVLVKEPDSPVQVFNLGPRVLMTEPAGYETGLIAPTSRVRYTAMVRLPAEQDPETVAAALEARLPDSYAQIETYERAQPRVQRFMGRLTDYLNLVGLAALLLGGIGVAGAVRVFVAQKLDTLAVLKCVGATSRELLAVYGLLALGMGLLGSVLGVALGYGAQIALPYLLRDLLPVSVKLQWPWAAAGEGMALGLITTLWFALPPILSLRDVPPARVFRRLVEGSGSGPAGSQVPVPLWRRRWMAPIRSGVPMLLLAAVLTVWQAGFTEIAGWFIVGLTGGVAVLHLAALGLLSGLRRLPKPAGFELKQGLSSLYRPGNQSGAVVMSLGLGVLLLLAVFLIQQDLLRQLVRNSPETQDNLFFIDIQPDQRPEFERILAKYGHTGAELTPIVRARIAGMKGARLRFNEIDDEHRKRHLRFEYALTYRSDLIEGEEVLEGRFNDPAVSGPQVSVADWFIEDSDLNLGESLTVDIQGVLITATITSIREADWQNRRAAFSFVFNPGVLEEAPKMFISSAREPDEIRRVALQRDVAEALPNVTALDVELIYQIVQTFMDRIGVVIQFMAGFCIAVGLVILLGAIATTKYQRIREAVLLKTLGATRGAVARVLTVEYGILGVLSGLVGAVAAGIFSYALVTYVFEGGWDLTVPPYLWAWFGTAAVIVVTGLASSVDVLVKKPLEVLRDE